jgi:hypothetical protein
VELKELLGTLEYDRSPNFLPAERLAADRDNAHIYRKASEECGLYGVYALRGSLFGTAQADIPVVYVCHAESEQEADAIHKKVWNQNVAPFVLVASPRNIRLYSGFKYGRPNQQLLAGEESGVLRTLTSFNEVASTLKAFRAECVDSGDLWKEWGTAVTPESRVDWKLLKNLEQLDQWLVGSGIEDRSLSHSIIGKFVYLRYLKDRQILSDRKLEEWNLTPAEVFSRGVSMESFLTLIDRLDDWLNGSVFPITNSKIRQLGVHRLRQVAAVFNGDTVYGQLHLDFEAYDFSFIPIETLSVIYEQFLHAAGHESGHSEGRRRGAYYTPVPLVNFMLDQMDVRKPLQPGMRVLDPACGSGVFLVQCYRKLIEQKVRKSNSVRPKPVELRDLLTEHIFGIDRDSDACQIAELSLILTLLDYVKPPDLTQTRFKLPVLGGKNIFQGDAFDEASDWSKAFLKHPFDWVVGNPPWIELHSERLDALDKAVFNWIGRNKNERPTGGNQVAEAFAWRACEWMAREGLIGLLVPAMTFFKYESKSFRKAFFGRTDVWSVANFANLAEVLFAGRSRVPAAALFYSCRTAEDERPHPETVEVYSPFVANQVVHDPGGPGRRVEIWSIVVNASEIWDVRYSDILTGDELPWKIASWGTPFDNRLLESVSHRFPMIKDLEEKGVLFLSEGLQLRAKRERNTGEELEPHPDLAGKPILDVDPLKKRRYLFRLPQESIGRVPKENTYVRKGRFALPFSVSEPPHVLVGASRSFAIYHDRFLIVPPRQIGIASRDKNQSFLKALALYLNSDFAFYYQFFASPQLGVKRLVSTLRALRHLPVPFQYDHLGSLAPWITLFQRAQALPENGEQFFDNQNEDRFDNELATILNELNDLTSEALRLDSRQRAAVHDLVHIRMALDDGRVGSAATRPPTKAELRTYATRLQSELDDFLGEDSAARHRIEVCTDGQSGIVEIELVRDARQRQPIGILDAGDAAARQFEEARHLLREKRSQWVYFNRNLRIYEGATTYLFKPFRRMHWAESQAIVDAGEVIAETLQPNDAHLERVAG